ncbi:MAG TPA: polysaccharide deacetylase family protein [Phycisphaerae bacterium]|nr:polysaccharide deacetylase family protein [Phycisphaerae bacterium]
MSTSRNQPPIAGAWRRCIHAVWAAAWGVVLAISGGCGTATDCHSETANRVTVVLTFDDGPLAADQSLDNASGASVELLDQLNAILDTLNRRGARAVFYIEGPGDDETGSAVQSLFADGLRSIHDQGHVLGYHAFNHDPAIWSQTLGPPFFGRTAMRSDLVQLTAYLDTTLEVVGANRLEWFTPVYRQPFGGSGISRSEAEAVAQELGWIYHGFVIDSVDWTDNLESDPTLTEGLPFETDTERVEFVRRRIRSGIFRNWDREVIDILFHVNAFTAANLDAWIDEIETAYSQKVDATIELEVPDCYLTTPDAQVDRTLVEDVIRGL